MTIVIQRENIKSMLPEGETLLRMHYDEIAWRKDKIELAPDWDFYARLEMADALIAHSVRDGGRLIGYSVFFIRKNPHYRKTLFAVNDIVFVHPAHRGGVGAKLIAFSEADLRSLGVQVISYHIKTYMDWSGLAARMGYEAVETNHWKWVGE